MFYDELNFKDVIGEKVTRVSAAKSANEVIDKEGVLFFGRMLEDGTGLRFSTNREKGDTHVCIGIGIKEMAFFAPEDKYARRDRPSETELMNAKNDRIKNLEKELSLYRSKDV